MRFSQFSSTSLSLATLCTLSQARPLFHHEKRDPEAAPQSYSVVPVDGGSSANNGPLATSTVTNVLTQTQIQTLVSTVTAGGSESVVTVITTQYIPTTVMQPVTVTAETTVAETTTMVMEPSVTSVPYDNGQWHTSYFYRSTLSNVLIPVSSAAAASTTAQGTSTITAAAEFASSTASASTTASTSTDWAHYYGTWQSAPVNGSWWGRRTQEMKPRLAQLS